GGIPTNSRKWDLSFDTFLSAAENGGEMVAYREVETITYVGDHTTYKVVTESGKELRASKNCLLLTKTGLCRVDYLTKGVGLIVKGSMRPTSYGGRKKNKKRTII